MTYIPSREQSNLVKQLWKHGYAPGDYIFLCGDCGQEAIGDKRVWRCEPCAQKRLEASQPPAQAQSDLVKRARQEANWSIRPPEHRKIISELADRIEALEAAAVRNSQCEAALVEALEVTAGNLRSLGPAGALAQVYEPYSVWLTVVESALAAYDTPAVTSEPNAPHDGRGVEEA